LHEPAVLQQLDAFRLNALQTVGMSMVAAIALTVAGVALFTVSAN